MLSIILVVEELLTHVPKSVFFVCKIIKYLQMWISVVARFGQKQFQIQ